MRESVPTLPPPPLPNYVATLHRIADLVAALAADEEIRTRLLQFAEQLNQAQFNLTDKTAAAISGNWMDMQTQLDQLHSDIDHLATHVDLLARDLRSEERRVGKECRSRWAREHSKKKYKRK